MPTLRKLFSRSPKPKESRDRAIIIDNSESSDATAGPVVAGPVAAGPVVAGPVVTNEDISERLKNLDPENILVTVNNLLDDFGRGQRSVTFETPKSTTISALITHPSRNSHVLRTPDALVSKDGREYDFDSRKTQIQPFDEVVVTEGLTNDMNQMGQDERLIAFNARRYGKPVQINVTQDDTSHGKAVDCLSDNSGLRILLLRTIRMPDDGKLHSLPAALGAFPLYNAAAYAGALPEKIVKDGGVFFPMWQREALWIGLKANIGRRFALRVSVGRINAISGQSIDDKSIHGGREASVQDYVVVPGQDWLDGICVGPGTVRQFVAMPLGSGYTVEGQKTGEEKHGGLQIEVISSFRERLRGWTTPLHVAEEQQALDNMHRNSSWLDEKRTPRELGLTPGNKIHGYPLPPTHLVPYTVADLVEHGTQQVTFSARYWENLARGMDYGDIYEPQEMSISGHSFSSPRNASNALPRHYNLPRRGDTIDDRYTSSAGPTPLAAETDDVADDDGLYRSGIESDEAFEDEEGNEANVSAPKNDLSTMGLAAGGMLVQDIYKDQYDPAMWNTAGSKLINIHILDPASCESVTHIVPAPPPIDAEAYAKAGLQFYAVEERPDDRLEGGDFSDVKSVAAMDKQKLQMEEKPLDPTILVECRCGKRLCDCVIRPCNHQLCHMCVREVDTLLAISGQAQGGSKSSRRCPVCQAAVSHVAGFAAPMNLPGEEPIKMRVPVQLLEVRDGRMAFKSVVKSRI